MQGTWIHIGVMQSLVHVRKCNVSCMTLNVYVSCVNLQWLC